MRCGVGLQLALRLLCYRRQDAIFVGVADGETQTGGGRQRDIKRVGVALRGARGTREIERRTFGGESESPVGLQG